MIALYRISPIFIPVLLLGMLTLTSCGKKESVPMQEKKEATSESPKSSNSVAGEEASYDPEKGLFLPEETKRNLGLEFAPTQNRSVASTVSLTAQVYRSASEAVLKHGDEKRGFAYATAMETPNLIEKLKPAQKLEFFTKQKPDQRHSGAVWKLSPDQLAAVGKVEVLLELPDSDSSLHVGDFIEAVVSNNGSSDVLTIPSSSVLHAPNGTFVFVQNGNFLRRIPVKIGAQDADFVEAAEGLRSGELVLSKAVEAVYLIELRFVKGGAHAD